MASIVTSNVFMGHQTYSKIRKQDDYVSLLELRVLLMVALQWIRCLHLYLSCHFTFYLPWPRPFLSIDTLGACSVQALVQKQIMFLP